MSNRSFLLGCRHIKKSIIFQEWLFFQERTILEWDLCSLEKSFQVIINFFPSLGAYQMITLILLHIMNAVNKGKPKLLLWNLKQVAKGEESTWLETFKVVFA